LGEAYNLREITTSVYHGNYLKKLGEAYNLREITTRNTLLRNII